MRGLGFRAVSTGMALALVVAISGCSGGGVDSTEGPSYDEVVVTQGALSTTMKWSGVLTYDSPFEVVYQVDETTASATGQADQVASTTEAGIVTWIIDRGTVVANGDVLYRVNDVPVIFLEGGVVLWRELGYGVTGSDVKAVEQALADLGYDPYTTVTVDTYFTWRTYQMVERFQEAKGLDETGEFDYRSAVMQPGSVVVSDVSLAVGDEASSGTTVLTVSDTTRVVGFSVLPSERASVAVGDEVWITLPSRETVAGTVTFISAGLDADTYSVTATLIENVIVDGDKIDVSVLLTVPIEDEALIVPSTAIIVRDDGTVSVVVVRGGELVFVEVAILGTSGQSTAVRSDGLIAGDIVAVR